MMPPCRLIRYIATVALAKWMGMLNGSRPTLKRPLKMNFAPTSGMIVNALAPPPVKFE